MAATEVESTSLRLAALALTTALTPVPGRTANYAPGNVGTFVANSTAASTAASGLVPLTGCLNGVITTDASGNAQCTALAQFVIQAIPPGAPTVSAAAAGQTGITLSVMPPVLNGGAAITGYMLSQGTAAGAEGAATAIALTGGSYSVTGLTAGTTHYFKVAAVNSAGTGASSAEASAATASLVVTVPGAPTISVTPGNGQTVVALGVDGAANNAAITTRTLYRATTAGGETTGAAVSLPYTDTVANGVTEYYQLTDTNSAGEGARSVEVSATPNAAITRGLALGGTGTASSTIAFPGSATAVVVTVKVPAGTDFATGASGEYRLAGAGANPFNYYFVVRNGNTLGAAFTIGGNLDNVTSTAIIPTGTQYLQVAMTVGGNIVFSTAGSNGVYSQLGGVFGTNNAALGGAGPAVLIGGGGIPTGFKLLEASVSVNGATLWDLPFAGGTPGAGTITDAQGHAWAINSPASIQ